MNKTSLCHYYAKMPLNEYESGSVLWVPDIQENIDANNKCCDGRKEETGTAAKAGPDRSRNQTGEKSTDTFTAGIESNSGGGIGFA